jgi:hypothetical protein
MIRGFEREDLYSVLTKALSKTNVAGAFISSNNQRESHHQKPDHFRMNQ